MEEKIFWLRVEVGLGEQEGKVEVGAWRDALNIPDSCHIVGARGYLHSQNRFLLIFRIPPVATQAPIMSCVNPMLVQDLTIHTQLVPL